MCNHASQNQKFKSGSYTITLIISWGAQKKRITSVYDYDRGPYSYQHNMIVAYDQMWKKLGSGIGTYLNLNLVPNFKSTNPYFKSSSSYNIGFSFAPKYNILKKNKTNEVRFTWSPFISVDYSKQITIYDTSDIIFNYDTLFTYQVPEDIRHRQGRFNIGGLLNSKRLMLGAGITYNIRNYFYFEYTRRTYLSYMFLIGYSFPKNESSLLGISFLGKIQFRINRPNQMSNSLIRFDQLYTNINLRIWKFYAGIANPMYYYIGYKAKNWKVTTGISLYSNMTNSKKYLGLSETSISYTFK